MLRGFDYMGNWDGMSDTPYMPAPMPDISAAASDAAQYGVDFWTGNSTSSSTTPVPATGYDPNLGKQLADNFIPDAAAPLTPEQAQTAAATLAANSASISPSVANMWASQGVNLNNIIGTAGAIFRLTQQPNGTYTPVAVNAQAQAQMAAKAQTNKMLLLAAGAALLLAVLT